MFKSQLAQDKWVLSVLGFKSNGYFVEVGAADGLTLSNTYYFEKQLYWNGICIEANENYWKDLDTNRSCHKSHYAVSSNNSTGFLLDSGLNSKIIDASDLPQIDPNLIKKIESRTLSDILESYNAPKYIDYMSMDIEGHEYDTLKAFPFEKYQFSCITIEHNEPHIGPAAQNLLRQLLTANNYVFIMGNRDVNNWGHGPIDDFYVHQSILQQSPPKMLKTKTEIDEFLKHDNYYNHNALISNPQPVELQAEPHVIYLYASDIIPEYSVVMPVYNQESIIIENITSIIINTTGKFELIIIIDACFDNTLNLIQSFMNSLKIPSNISRLICIEQKTSLFETPCDNIGFRLSCGKYIVEIQADMKIITYGYNEILARPVKLWNDIIAVSGRCAHNLCNYNGIGKLDFKIEKPLSLSYDQMDKFHIYESCVRGPLLLVSEKLRILKYLDEQNFFLNDSDHDLFARALYAYNWRTGYFPIEFYAPLCHGSTRKKSNENEDNIKILGIRHKRSNGGFFGQIKSTHKTIPSETRIIDNNKLLSTTDILN